MTTAPISPALRLGRRVAKMWAEIDDAERRMFEIKIGVRPPTRREHEALPASANATQPHRGSRDSDGAAVGLMC